MFTFMIRMGVDWDVAWNAVDCHAGANLARFEDRGFNAMGRLREAYDNGVVHTLQHRPTRPKE